MKTIKFILLFSLLAGGVSCKKELKKTVVDGVVRDFTTGNPLAGVEVYLQTGENKDVDHSFENPTTFLSAITGSDGKFHFEFKALRHNNYALEYQKPSECYYDNGAGQTINKGETNNIDIKLHSYPLLYVHVKNVTPYDVNDQICYYLNKDITGCITPPVTGALVDYVDQYNPNAFSKIYIKSFVTKNGILTVKLDSINVINPCDTLTYDLFY
jgi:hypothetical protein